MYLAISVQRMIVQEFLNAPLSYDFVLIDGVN